MNLVLAEKLFELAKNVAPVANAKIVSAVVYRGIIFGLGTNSYKTHPIAKEHHNTPHKECLHAEMDALIKASYNLSKEKLAKSEIYIVRAKRNGDKGLAKPCLGCQSLIKNVGIKDVYYTLDGWGYFEKL